MRGRVFRWGLLGSTAVALLVGGVSGGPRRKVHVIEIPRLREGAIPKDASANAYMFLEEETPSLWLAYPGDLSYENFGKGRGAEPLMSRVQLAIGVRPVVATRVIPIDGGFRYEFEVGNEAGAVQGIAHWCLSLTATDHVRQLDGPGAWNFRTHAEPEGWDENTLSVINMIPGTPKLTVSDLIRAEAKWWYLSTTAVVEPGGEPKTFSLESTWLPGLVTAYFQGKPYKAWTDASVPEVLGNLVPAFNSFETNSVSLPVLGPKYEPAVPARVRVCSFLADLRDLMRGGRLQPTDFVNGLQEMGASCLEKSIPELKTELRRLRPGPGDRFEEDLLDALMPHLSVE